MNKIQHVYEKLFAEKGPQGWWPLLDVKGTNPTKTGSLKGYHPGDYSYPKTEEQKFEIIVGAVLIQYCTSC
jgi:endonuclease-3 related protein